MKDRKQEYPVESDGESASTATSSDGPTQMYREADEAAAVARLLKVNRNALAALGERLRAAPPAVVVTCTRGSSDHAATYGKYLIETLLGVPVASAAPSVSSVYAAPIALGTSLVIAVSQSGRSSDLLATVSAYQDAGAFVAAFVNDEASPLAEMADTMIALKAGPERSVAATKSRICALAAFAALTAAWSRNDVLAEAIDTLPNRLTTAFDADWSAMVDTLADANNLFVIGRGYGYGIAPEATLKLQETCALHAKAFSAAEVRDGPMAIVNDGFPVIAFATSETAGDGVREAAAEFSARGAIVCLADAKANGAGIRAAFTAHPAIELILMIQSFYRMANSLSLRRGPDPDAPLHLSKVTKTV